MQIVILTEHILLIIIALAWLVYLGILIRGEWLQLQCVRAFRARLEALVNCQSHEDCQLRLETDPGAGQDQQ